MLLRVSIFKGQAIILSMSRELKIFQLSYVNCRIKLV